MTMKVLATQDGVPVSSSNPLPVAGTLDTARQGAVADVAAGSIAAILDALLVALYNAVPPTITDTRYNALQLGQRGSLRAELRVPDSANALGVGNVADQASAASILDALVAAIYNATPPTLTDTRFNALQLGSRGSLRAELRVADSASAIGAGNVADQASAASILDALMVAIYNATPPTVTDTRFNALQLGSRGSLRTELRGADSATAIGTAAPADALSSPTLALQVLSHVMQYGGATWNMRRVPTVFKVINGGSLTGGTEYTLWTPAAGKKFRLMGLYFGGSASGFLTFKDNTAGTTILQVRTASSGSQPQLWLENGILSAAANNVFTVTPNTTMQVDGLVFGTEE